jgi:very-short-patch-repair endonuclease
VIQDYLSLYGIRYTREKTFDGCKDKAKLKFDFYLDNGLVIEFDGEQHFKETAYFSSRLEDIQRRDHIKDTYCKTHGIPLLRIRYDQVDQIPALIDDFIYQHMFKDSMAEVAAAKDNLLIQESLNEMLVK